MRLAMLVTVLALAGAAAAYQELPYVELLADPQDHDVDWLDILSVGIAEPGNNSFILRGTLAGTGALDPSAVSFVFGFMTDVDNVAGVYYNGAPRAHAANTITPADWCRFDDAAYCGWSYDSLGIGPGTTLTRIWAYNNIHLGVTYQQDIVPGGISGVDGYDPRGDGANHTLAGGGPTRLEGAKLNLELEETNATDTRHFVWNANGRLDVAAAGAVEAGRVDIVVRDANGTFFEANFTSAKSGSKLMPTNAAEDWIISVTMEAFSGRVSLTAAPPIGAPVELPAETSEPPATATMEPEDTGAPENETMSETAPAEDTPGLGPLAVLVVAACVYFVRRR